MKNGQANKGLAWRSLVQYKPAEQPKLVQVGEFLKR